MNQLSAIHRRKHTVARMFNEKGYRTRKNRKWQWAQIKTMLADPSAKGVHFFNRTKKVGSWKTIAKPESQWGQVQCEAIVPESLWNQVNQILEEQSKAWKKPGRLPTQTFSRLAWCSCGGKMYARHDSPKYLCRKCNNKIPIQDLENIFHEELEGFFANPEKLASNLEHAAGTLKMKEGLLANHQESVRKIRDEMQRTHRLFVEGNITSQGFGDFYKPAEERLNQLLTELPKLQAEIDLLRVNRISTEDVMKEANSLVRRKQAGLSHKQLAVQTGFRVHWLRRWEFDRCRPAEPDWVRLRKVLKLPRKWELHHPSLPLGKLGRSGPKRGTSDL